MASKARRKSTNIKVMLVAPIIIAVIVISFTFFGFYLADALGISQALLAGAMATIGLGVSIVLVARFVDAMVKRDALVEKTADKPTAPQ
ncbi:MAG: hypothetical protein HYU03_03845 [Thaumarchaeota archaeon]|nr:hypothetical protein [Nitrososphaerota archaeon]MBI3023465.1 hypothetical protein [Nitrososphaerota archaeon]MBI3116244.1 hypothetical protein [Nitrososphaerota archaeon]MCS4539807.1 hypothetical protein [Nitrososphaerota archaeon]